MTAVEMPMQWYDLPTGAKDWLRPGETGTLWLARDMSDADRLHGFDQLQQWDALVGRMTRARLFDDTEDCRAVRMDAEAVAAVAEALAVRLGVER